MSDVTRAALIADEAASKMRNAATRAEDAAREIRALPDSVAFQINRFHEVADRIGAMLAKFEEFESAPESDLQVCIYALVEIRNSTILWQKTEAGERLKQIHDWAAAALNSVKGTT